LIRSRRARVPQEAIIGITYAVASAAAILAMSKATAESEHLKDMLVGNILAVSWGEVGNTAVLYAVIGAFHFVFRRKFLLISMDPDRAEREGPVAEGTYQTAAYLANLTTSANTAWVASYHAAFPQEPPPNQTAVATYDAVKLLATLIGDVGTDRTKLRNALAEVGTARPAYEGISGHIAFDSLGDVPEKKVLIAQARGGITRAVEGAP
jgi:ABC-type branched-subunit amino acid transport system substrate-binding protein